MVRPLAAEILAYINEEKDTKLLNISPTITDTVADPIQSVNLLRKLDFAPCCLMGDLLLSGAVEAATGFPAAFGGFSGVSEASNACTLEASMAASWRVSPVGDLRDLRGDVLKAIEHTEEQIRKKVR